MNQAYLKYAAGAGLFILWAVLVETGHADPQLVEAIKWAMGAIGVYHGITNLQATTQQPQLPAELVALLKQVSAAPPAPQARTTYPTIPLTEGKP